MSRTDRMRNEAALKPIGVALAAVVAGLGAGNQAQASELRTAPPPTPTPQERTHYVDPTAHPGYDLEDVLVLDTLADPLADAPAEKRAEKPAQADLFDPNVPLGRTTGK